MLKFRTMVLTKAFFEDGRTRKDQDFLDGLEFACGPYRFGVQANDHADLIAVRLAKKARTNYIR